jgi:hypothetical protein
VRGDTGRLVDDDDVVIVVDDPEIGDDDRHDRWLRLRHPRHLEPTARRQSVGLAEHAPVDLHSPGLCDLRRECSGEAQQFGDGRVDPLPRETLRHGQAARFHGQP